MSAKISVTIFREGDEYELLSEIVGNIEIRVPDPSKPERTGLRMSGTLVNSDIDRLVELAKPESTEQKHYRVWLGNRVYIDGDYTVNRFILTCGQSNTLQLDLISNLETRYENEVTVGGGGGSAVYVTDDRAAAGGLAFLGDELFK